MFQHLFHFCGNLCLFALLGILQQIVIAVDHQQQHTGTGIGIFILQPQNICDFQELYRNNFLLILNIRCGMYPIAEAIVLHEQIPVLIQRCQIQMNHILHCSSQRRAALKKPGGKRGIVPQDFTGVCGKQHGNCHALECIHTCAFNVALGRHQLLPLGLSQPEPLQANHCTD